MRSTIKYINIGLVILISSLVILGITLNILGSLQFSTRLFYAAAISFPILLATKGMEYMLQNLLMKAILSIILLSLVCMMSIAFVFI